MSLPAAAREVVNAWLTAFNQANLPGLMALYAREAIFEHPLAGRIEGREAIQALLATPSTTALHPVNLLEDGEWAVLEWRDEQDHRGCDLFNIRYGKIVLHRRYVKAGETYTRDT